MIPLRPEGLRSVLCVGAHADDIEIGCGGTILRLLEGFQGVEVCWVVMSGCGTRTEEARRSADRFLAGAGSRRIEVLDFQDAGFPYVDPSRIKDAFRQLARSCDPDLIFTHRREDLHQDHRLVAEMTWQHFRNHLILEYEIPKYEGDLGQPSVFVPLTKEIAEAKIDIAVSEFRSQHEKPWFDRDTFFSMLRIRGLECQSPTQFAEAFYGRKLLLM